MVGTNLYKYDKLRSGKHKCFFCAVSNVIIFMHDGVVNDSCVYYSIAASGCVWSLVGSHILPSPAPQDIRSHPFTQDAKVGAGFFVLYFTFTQVRNTRWGFGPFKTLRSRRRSEQNPQCFELLECVQSTHNFYHIVQSNGSRTASEN